MHLPGRPHPGMSTPSAHTPGFETPGDTEPTTLSATGVAIDATGTTDLGTIDGDRDVITVVTVTPTEADFDFNVNVDGTPVFASDQSPAAAAEENFSPNDAAGTVVAAADETLAFEVISQSGTNNATADVDVTVLSETHI